MPDFSTLDLDTVPGGALDPEQRLWASFAAADSTRALCRSWLALQCRTIEGVERAMLLMTRPDGLFAPMAVWPDAAQSFDDLKPAAEACLAKGVPSIQRPDHQAGLHIGYPFLGETDAPVGAVVLDLRHRPEPEIQAALRSLHWGVGWLEAQALRDRMLHERQRLSMAAIALDLVAVANEEHRLEASAMAVANELAVRLKATRVAIGLAGRNGTRLVALSHTAWFKRNTSKVIAVEAAMDEAMDQRATVRIPAALGEASRILVAHEALRTAWGDTGQFASFVLHGEHGAVGAVTIIHDETAPGMDDAVHMAEAVCALLGPILDAKRRARRMVSGRIVDALHDVATAAAGPRHLGWKLAGGLLASAVIAALLIPMPFRVSSKAVLEGRVQRVVAAPFEGFIASAPVHAGDMVRQGEVLAVLDDKDLLLERARWEAERGRMLVRGREAMAKHDRTATLQIEAQQHQAEAQLSLVAEKLARTRLLAPIDGLVVSGDLSQSIGGPVETGKVLFEVAPLDTYRVILRADEHDIRHIHAGQEGHVLLHGLSGGTLAFIVDHITSVAETDSGRNTFRVEATLEAQSQSNLRPGMEGVAKVDVGRHSIAWVWTRSLVDWARMLIWTWTP